MRFGFSADQLGFRDAFRELLERECTPQVVREAHDAGLWKRVGEMGVLGLRGELDEIDLVLLLEEAGRALLPGPFLATAAVGVPALAEAGESEWLDRVASGDAVLTVGVRGEPVAFAEMADVFVLGSDRDLHVVPRTSQRDIRNSSFVCGFAVTPIDCKGSAASTTHSSSSSFGSFGVPSASMPSLSLLSHGFESTTPVTAPPALTSI